MANNRFQTVYNNIGLEPKHTVWTYALVIWNLGIWNSVKWNETRRIGAILHPFESRGFLSNSWAFLFLNTTDFINECTVIQLYFCYNIHYGRDVLNYFGSRQVTEFSQQLAISHPTRSDFKYPSDFGFPKKCPISVGFRCRFGIRHIPNWYSVAYGWMKNRITM